MSDQILADLASTIRSRRTAASDKSYTKKLLDSGPEYCARKLGEEAVEAVIAAISGSQDELKAEAADLLYHLLVLLEVRDVSLDEVLAVLDKRTSQSGLEEKAARSQS
ncbi:MAG: phosphoribosyl-ATP diphosphatase [Pseudomonadota bacterium]